MVYKRISLSHTHLGVTPEIVKPDPDLLAKVEALKATREKEVPITVDPSMNGIVSESVSADPDIHSKFSKKILERRTPIDSAGLPTEPTQLVGISTQAPFLSPVTDVDRDSSYTRSQQSMGYCESKESMCLLISPDYVLVPSHCYPSDGPYSFTFPHTQETKEAVLSYRGTLGFAIFKLDRSVTCPTAPLQAQKAQGLATQFTLSGKTVIPTTFREMNSTYMTLASFMDGEGCDRLTKPGDCGSIRVDKHTGCIYAIHNGKQKTHGQQTAHPTGIPIADIIAELSTQSQALADLMIHNLRHPESWKIHASTAPYMDDALELEGKHEDFTPEIKALIQALNGPKTNTILNTELSFDSSDPTQYHAFIKDLRSAAETAYLNPNCLGLIFKVDNIDCVICTQDDSKWYWVGMKIELSKKIKKNEWRSFTNTHYTTNSSNLIFSERSLTNSLKNIKKWRPKDKANGKNVNDIEHRIDTSDCAVRHDLATFAFFICEAIRFDSVFDICINCLTNNTEIEWDSWHKNVLKHWDDMIKHTQKSKLSTSSKASTSTLSWLYQIQS